MYLNGELAKKTDEILELQEKVQILTDEGERQTLEYEAKMAQFKESSSTTIAKRVSESGQKGPEAVLNEENGVSLMVTRSLGDPYGSAAVIPHPQIIRPRSPNLGIGVPRGTRFILASDGLWDVMSSENAANHIRKVSDPLKAAGKLAAIAQNRWMNTLRRIDDIAVSVIDLV